MIVDLERNDLGKVCEYGSVHVADAKRIEEHPTVFHLVGTVEGKLRKELSHFDCLRATFPGGSITGAPKIRAMQIIEELEPTRRNIYTGALGYMGFNGITDLSILIRTLVQKQNQILFQVGSGIVSDSDPESEYLETLAKGKTFFDVLAPKTFHELTRQ
jgi:para-aminobenzoate synthetase component 1